MREYTQWSRLVGMALVFSLCAVGALADESQPTQTPGAVESEVVSPVGSDAQCGAAETFPPVFTTVLDQVRQNSCGCRDQCFSDFQCVLQNGPGSTCVPVGPCGCKECAATS